MKPKTPLNKKTKSPLDIEVGIYRWGRQGGYYWAKADTLRNVLEANHEGDKIQRYRKMKPGKLRNALKNTIEAFTPCGNYGKNPRVIGGELLSTTRQVQLDFDKQKIDLKKLFTKYKFITTAKPSCSGMGAFLLINVEGKYPYEEYFFALVEFFKKQKLVVDEAVSSINELRYCGLNGEGYVREYPEVWRETKKRPRTPITDIVVKGDGKVVEIPASQLGAMHYQDTVPWIAKNNHNGTPLATLVNYVKALTGSRVFHKDSHLNKSFADFETLARKIYDKYSTQHGEKVETLPMRKGDTWIEPVAFEEKEGTHIHQVQIVEEITKKYSFVFNTKVKEYYKYVGTHWQQVDRSLVEKFLVQVSSEIGYAHKKSQSLNFRKQLYELFTLTTAGTIQTDNTAFNLRNGILVFNDDNETVKLVEHDPKRMFCYVLDYDYKPKENAPLFEKFINRVMPSKDDQKLFWECIAGAFIHKIKLEYSLFLVGGGETGKSTLLNVIESLFGDACSSFSMRALTSRTDGDRAAREAFKIYNKSIALSRDDTGMSESTLWRKIASREPISVKTLYSNEFETTNYARLVLAVNEKPIIEASHAAQRRLIAIEMNERILDKEKDYRLIHKLLEERTGILNHLVEGFRRIMKTGGKFTISERAEDIRKSIIVESDSIQQWLDYRGIKPCGEPMGIAGRGVTLVKRFEQKFSGLMEPGTVQSEQIINLFNEKNSDDRKIEGTYMHWATVSNEWLGMRYRKFRSSIIEKGFVELRNPEDGKMYVFYYSAKR